MNFGDILEIFWRFLGYMAFLEIYTHIKCIYICDYVTSPIRDDWHLEISSGFKTDTTKISQV